MLHIVSALSEDTFTHVLNGKKRSVALSISTLTREEVADILQLGNTITSALSPAATTWLQQFSGISFTPVQEIVYYSVQDSLLVLCFEWMINRENVPHYDQFYRNGDLTFLFLEPLTDERETAL